MTRCSTIKETRLQWNEKCRQRLISEVMLCPKPNKIILCMEPEVKYTYHCKALSLDTMALPVGRLKLSFAQKHRIKWNKSKLKHKLKNNNNKTTVTWVSWVSWAHAQSTHIQSWKIEHSLIFHFPVYLKTGHGHQNWYIQVKLNGASSAQFQRCLKQHLRKYQH